MVQPPMSEYEQRMREQQMSHRGHTVLAMRGSDGVRYYVVAEHRSRGRAGWVTRLGARTEIQGRAGGRVSVEVEPIHLCGYWKSEETIPAIYPARSIYGAALTPEQERDIRAENAYEDARAEEAYEQLVADGYFEAQR